MASPGETEEIANKERMMKKQLFTFAMKGDWDVVLNLYRNEPLAHKAKITRSGDTALHIAVSNGQEDTVKHLVALIRSEDLRIKNERGNTPLHSAASMGSVRMCKFIANVDPELVGARNKDGETPFFLAALHGNRDAFLCLQNLCDSDTKKGESYGRRTDGNTILHCAISGDNFDLAHRIILRYNNLVNSVNEEGITPLHLLANKPSAFRSGSHLSWLNKIIYHCIFVDELKRDPLPIDTSEDKMNSKYPPNYQTCINFFLPQQNVIPGETPEFSETTIENGENPEAGHPGNRLFPSNYDTCFEIIKFVSKAVLVFLGLGYTNAIRKLRNKKEKHTWSVQIMNELLQSTSPYEYEYDGKNPHQELPWTHKDVETTAYSIGEDQLKAAEPTVSQATDPKDLKHEAKNSKGEEKQPDERAKKETPILMVAKNGVTEMVEKILQLFRVVTHDINSNRKNIVILAVEEKQPAEKAKKETPILIAAKNGVTEMVEKILEHFPVAIHDMNSDGKNIVLLAVENRQPHIFQLLLKQNILKDTTLRTVDNRGNSALHLAATLGEYTPWLIPGAALQMQWEIKWYEFVKKSMPLHFVRNNKDGKTPKEVFKDTHKDLVKMGGKWLNNTSNSCSVVAALIATVAFATSTTVPGGLREDNGTPTLEGKPAFNVFAISSLIALCFSVTALTMFLAILTSRHQEREFGKDLPRKLLIGLTSLFISIASMLLSFCAGHFFVLKDKLKYAAFPVYAVTCLPITFFAVAQFPLYFDLIWANFKKVPQRSYQMVPL